MAKSDRKLHEARMAGAAWLMNVIKTEAICDGDIIWDDLIETLKEETGLEFTIRENK